MRLCAGDGLLPQCAALLCRSGKAASVRPWVAHVPFIVRLALFDGVRPGSRTAVGEPLWPLPLLNDGLRAHAQSGRSPRVEWSAQYILPCGQTNVTIVSPAEIDYRHDIRACQSPMVLPRPLLSGEACHHQGGDNEEQDETKDLLRFWKHQGYHAKRGTQSIEQHDDGSL